MQAPIVQICDLTKVCRYGEIEVKALDRPSSGQCIVQGTNVVDKKHNGYVAEIAPDANRSKGMLQLKVQVENPDKFLTPELTAKVDFLAD